MSACNHQLKSHLPCPDSASITTVAPQVWLAGWGGSWEWYWGETSSQDLHNPSLSKSWRIANEGHISPCTPKDIFRITFYFLFIEDLQYYFQVYNIGIQYFYSSQYASKFGKLNSGHRTGKGQFSFQSQRKVMPKNVLTIAQLHSIHLLTR